MRAVIVPAVALIVAVVTTPVAANQEGTVPPDVPAYPMTFPIVGEVHYSDTWHAPRSGGRFHLGTDIMADKMTPVVAAAAGTVGWIHDDQGGDCCAMALLHDDGWESLYIHLNNDTPGTDDGLGWGFAPGIEGGAHVDAGQLIGYVGDSGNAEGSSSHLHFELHVPGFGPTNPYPHLAAALRIPSAFEGSDHPPCPEGATCDSVAFVNANSTFYVHDQIRRGPRVDTFFYGDPGDVPLMGDWNCDGQATPAMYRPSNGFMYLRNSNTQGVADVAYFYGNPDDIPVAGDFDGDGCDSLAIYRADEGKVYVKNTLGTGTADYSYFFGVPGDKPFVGDFDGDGIDTLGLHRESSGFVYFRDANTDGPAHYQFFYGNPGDRLIAGDWDGDGSDTVAVYRPNEGMLYVKLANAQGNADYAVPVGDFSAALQIAWPPRPPELLPDLASCAFDAQLEGRDGLNVAIHADAQEQAEAWALAIADGEAPDAAAVADSARLAVEADMGISYAVRHASWYSEPSCTGIGTGELLEGQTVFAGLAVTGYGKGTDRHTLVTLIEILALPKADYEAELGHSLTDADYELLVTEGLTALDS